MTSEENGTTEGFERVDFGTARGAIEGINLKNGRRERGGRISTPSEWVLDIPASRGEERLGVRSVW